MNNYTLIDYIKKKYQKQTHKFDEAIFRSSFHHSETSMRNITRLYNELAFEVIYDKNNNIISYKRLATKSLTKIREEMWSQYKGHPVKERILFDTQILYIYSLEKRRSFFIEDFLENCV
jgi:hypothetical protein